MRQALNPEPVDKELGIQKARACGYKGLGIIGLKGFRVQGLGFRGFDALSPQTQKSRS